MKKLCGTLMCFNGSKYDYNYKEAIQCLLDLCDYVIVAAGGEDDTFESVMGIEANYWEKIQLIKIRQDDWGGQHGKEKLNYFTNLAIKEAEEKGFEYQFNLQADEIIHEKSYSVIRKAIEDDDEAYMCKRINLWQSPYLQLNVSHDRLPCSSEIVRLAKTNCRSYGDAESIASNKVSLKYLNDIRIYHMGFVRKREIMKAKIINMQEKVFGIDHDPKLDKSKIFNPDLWFDPKKDLKPIDEPLPKLIQQWAKERYYGN